MSDAKGEQSSGTTRNGFVPLPDFGAMTAAWAGNYDQSNYDANMAGSVLMRSHALLERDFGPDRHFGKVLEVGAGTMVHLQSIRHRFDSYIASDMNADLIAAAARRPLREGVELQRLEGGALPFADGTFDRLIATHVLEHIPEPHLALAEWVRVLKPGGTLSLILPCDPGLAWRLGRHFGPRRRAQAAGLDYDYYMAREHVNSIYNLRQLLRYHLPNRKEAWWPLGFASPDFNLIYCMNAVV
ncbi:class I SAM-dependent methyltransferase [Novosphingobium sp.]|uniref:class I SAM-dependent methyltransferase n=1 Tax=Novosphingobium sp. TaxID=1874826 RepID=UPI00286DE072|nr:class I SAM-dependent methyltransferase [Novosphingobium sp.]